MAELAARIRKDMPGTDSWRWEIWVDDVLEETSICQYQLLERAITDAVRHLEEQENG